LLKLYPNITKKILISKLKFTFDGSDGAKPYAKKHKPEPAQSISAKGVIISCNNFIYHGVLTFSVNLLCPNS
jgi:hypothetical protein